MAGLAALDVGADEVASVVTGAGLGLGQRLVRLADPAQGRSDRACLALAD